MTGNPYQAGNAVATEASPQPGRTWRVAAGIARVLAVFLLIDSSFALSEELARWKSGWSIRPSRCPRLYLGIEELLVAITPRAVLLLPATVFFLRVTSTLTALAVVAGAAARLGTGGRLRIRMFELVAILLVSVMLGVLATSLMLVFALRWAG